MRRWGARRVRLKEGRALTAPHHLCSRPKSSVRGTSRPRWCFSTDLFVPERMGRPTSVVGEDAVASVKSGHGL